MPEEEKITPWGTKIIKIFTGGPEGGWITASALLLMLVTCWLGRIGDSKAREDKADKREAEIRGMVNEIMINKMATGAVPVRDTVRVYQQSLDSVKAKLDTIKSDT